MRPRELIFTFLANKIAAAASCGATTITSQSDADLVNACPTVTGDVILATNAAGIINLDGVQVIEGNFGSEGCSGTCASITSLSCAALVSVSQNLTLHNLPSLTNISLSQLQTVGAQFYLESLPSLQELSIPSLASVGLFHLVSAPKLLSMNLTGLQNVTGSDPSIEVVGVGLSYLANLNVNTNLSSFILRDSPNIQDVSLSTPQIDYLEVAGNGSGGFGTSVGNNFISRIGTLNVSGCSGLELSSPTTFDIMILSQNTFSSIFLDPVKVINNLSIVSNFNLNQALLPTDMSIQNIEISGNEVLESQHIVAGTEAWPWGIKNISSMILDGLFENIFFQAYNNLTLVEISQEFILNSQNQSFDCSFLNSLRTQGYFQGNYSCQGKTLAAGHVRTTSGSSASTISTPFFSIIAAIALSMAWRVL